VSDASGCRENGCKRAEETAKDAAANARTCHAQVTFKLSSIIVGTNISMMLDR
jgi:hypothetical protein